jgi:tetratricopeptide (TPR) repeat protein/AAA+ ATPase superfamily predicted ATPase
MIQKAFVGRNKEIDQIRDWLKGSPAKLVLLTGPGGIGKTSLLSKIEKEYSSGGDFLVEYFDLAEQPMTLLNQALHLADSLGREEFPTFMQKLTELDTSSDISASAGLEQAAVDVFVGEVAAYLQDSRKQLLRITDTFEIVLKYSMYGDDWAGGINERLKHIPGVFFLVAGRDKVDETSVLDKARPLLDEIFGGKNVLRLTLSGFNKVEMEEFFAECDPHRVVPQEMREKLLLLTDGKPILLSLAVEWLQRDVPIPDMTEKSLEELKVLFASQESREALLNEFEFELVSKVRQLHTPFDIAALYMAHVDRRMDSRLLSMLLDVSEADAEKSLEQMIQFPFVKEYVGSLPKKCALHDEMCKLVKVHAWEYLDINGTQRQHLTRKVIEKYYLPRIESLKKQKQNFLRESQSTLLQDVESRKSNLERWLLEAETLYYYLKLSKAEGYKYFDLLYYDSETNPVRDQILINEFKRADAYDEDKISLRRADELLRRGQRDESRRLCLKVLENASLENTDRMHVYNTLGQLDFNVSPGSAEQSYRKALNLAEVEKDLRSQALICNNLGRLYRNISHLDQSIEYFKRAQEIVRHLGNFELSGTINNNLAWTQRLNGDLDDAEALCSLSIAENRKRGLERPLAYAYLTKADIDRDRGDLREAEQYARQALDIFSRLSDGEGIVQVYRTFSTVYRALHNYDRALKYLNEGIQLANRGSYPLLLASLYQMRGRTYRHYVEYLGQQWDETDREYQSQRKKLLKEALSSLKQSIKLAANIEHRWEVARSELEIILILLMQESYDEVDLLNRLEKIWSTANTLDDEFLKGYVYENYARLKMKNGKYLEAGHDFGQAAYYVAQRPGVETARAFDRLRNLILDSHLDEEQANALATGTYETILQQTDYHKYPKLVALTNMCQHMLGLPVTSVARAF